MTVRGYRRVDQKCLRASFEYYLLGVIIYGGNGGQGGK